MAGQFENMPQCGKCSGYIPNMVNRLGLPLFSLTSDCKNHIHVINEKLKDEESGASERRQFCVVAYYSQSGSLPTTDK